LVHQKESGALDPLTTFAHVFKRSLAPLAQSRLAFSRVCRTRPERRHHHKRVNKRTVPSHACALHHSIVQRLPCLGLVCDAVEMTDEKTNIAAAMAKGEYEREGR